MLVGLAFDILMDVPTEKKRALRPIENPLGKKGGKKRRSAAELTKEGIEAKLAAAEERRNVSYVLPTNTLSSN